jgi:hypothetical protein
VTACCHQWHVVSGSRYRGGLRFRIDEIGLGEVRNVQLVRGRACVLGSCVCAVNNAKVVHLLHRRGAAAVCRTCRARSPQVCDQSSILNVEDS